MLAASLSQAVHLRVKLSGQAFKSMRAAFAELGLSLLMHLMLWMLRYNRSQLLLR